MALTDKLTAIGDQVRRIYKTEEEMTLDQMALNLSNVVTASELPSAEESSFGNNEAQIETGIATLGTFSYSSSSMKQYPFNKYTANEAISIVGLRVYPRIDATDKELYLYNENGELVRTISGINHVATTWTNAYFDKPVIIAKGESFWVSGSQVPYPPKATTSDTTFNGKVTCHGGTAKSSGFPSSVIASSIYGVVDIIIAPVQAELPDTYKVERTTMDDIAEEVQRIAGTEYKMSTAQIITALEAHKAISQFPSIPADVYAQYPYAFIRKNINTSYYQLYCTKGRGYYDPNASESNGGIIHGDTKDTGEYTSYQVPIASAETESEWIYANDGTGWFGIDANRAIMWSNYDIPNGSATATDIYFSASPLIV